MPSAVSTSVSTTAAAPSETSEQSVRFSGPATSGFLSDTWRQNSKPRSFRIWASGLAQPFLWFLAAIVASASRLVAMPLEIALGDLAEHAGEAALDAALLLEVGGAEQRLGDLGPGQVGHLLDADHQDEAGAPLRRST